MGQYYEWRGGQNEFAYAPYDLAREVQLADWERTVVQNRGKYRTRREYLAAKRIRDKEGRKRRDTSEDARNKREKRHLERAAKLGISLEEYLERAPAGLRPA